MALNILTPSPLISLPQFERITIYPLYKSLSIIKGKVQVKYYQKGLSSYVSSFELS